MLTIKPSVSKPNLQNRPHDDFGNGEVVVTGIESGVAPNASDVENWVELAREGESGDVFVNFVESNESRRLNQRFRNVDAPTNVLAFPAEVDQVLGDVAICADVARHEAATQGITVKAHFAHLVIHGVLHLRGFDHVKDSDAEQMEAKEIALLHSLGVANPYA